MTVNDDISRKDILQIDSTIIAGVLILFTLAFATGAELKQRLLFTTFPLTIIIPFALSAVYALYPSNYRRYKRSKAAMTVGFVYIMIFLLVITIVYLTDYIPDLSNFFSKIFTNSTQTIEVKPSGVPMNISKFI